MTFSPELEAKIGELLEKYPQGRERSAVVPMLLFAQDEVGAVTPDVVEEVARRTGTTPLQVREVVGYYSMLREKHVGRHHIQICTNISCMLTGGAGLFEHACKKLGIKNKEVTPDGEFSIEEVECIGACCWAPAVQVNYDFHHRMTPEAFDELIESLRKTR